MHLALPCRGNFIAAVLSLGLVSQSGCQLRLSSAPTDSKWKFKNLNDMSSVDIIDS